VLEVLCKQESLPRRIVALAAPVSNADCPFGRALHSAETARQWLNMRQGRILQRTLTCGSK
jgi:hypothetical protein